MVRTKSQGRRRIHFPAQASLPRSKGQRRMIHSLLIGLAAGARSITPLAAVSEAARQNALPADNGAPAYLGHPLVAAGSKALAAGELLGDKLESAPDRIVPAGLAARLVTGALAGAALAPRRQAALSALLGASGAIAAAYLTFGLRMRAMRRFGQKPTGVIEDALTLGATQWVVRHAASAHPSPSRHRSLRDSAGIGRRRPGRA